jgi:lysophospholipase L1-like esterase
MKNDSKLYIYSLIGLSVLAVGGIAAFFVFRKKDGSGTGTQPTNTNTNSGIKNPNPKKILIVGDSQVAIQNADGGKITYTYPNILKRELEPQGYTIDVVALGGKTTDWIKQNLENKLKTNRYDRIYIHGGGNDVNNASIPLTKTIGNFQYMVDLIRQSGADPFVVLGYKIEGTDGKFGNYNIMGLTRYLTRKEDWIPYIEKRKELQRRLPNEITNGNFVPVYDLNQNTNDGFHPNGAGHKIVAKKITESIMSN